MHAAVTEFNEFLRQEIQKADSHYRSPAHKSFVREIESFPKPSPITIDDVLAATDKERILYIANDHNSVKEADFTADIVMRYGCPKTNLHIEFASPQHQTAIDEYLKRGRSDKWLQEKIEYQNWHFPWRNVSPLLEAARKTGTKVHGTNRYTKGDKRRDQLIAREIAKIISKTPEERHLISYGDEHLAPSRVPAIVSKLTGTAPGTIIFQNMDEWFWTVMTEDWRKNAARINEKLYCIFQESPLIVNLQNYGLYNQVPEEETDENEVAQTPNDIAVRETITFFRRLFHAKAEYEEPDVVEPETLKQERRLKRYLDSNSDNIQYWLHEGRPRYIPRFNNIVIDAATLPEIGEPVMTFLLFAEKGLTKTRGVEPKEKRDLFWIKVAEQTLASYGTKLLNPLWRPPDIIDVTPRSLARYNDSIVRMDHHAPEYERIVSAVGDSLGEELFRANTKAEIPQRFIAEKIRERWDGRGSAYRLMQELSAAVARE